MNITKQWQLHDRASAAPGIGRSNAEITLELIPDLWTAGWSGFPAYPIQIASARNQIIVSRDCSGG